MDVIRQQVHFQKEKHKGDTNMNIKKIAILGAGTMGSQIAALMVNAGLEVKILDIVIDEKEPNKLSKKAYDRITHPKKGMLFRKGFSNNLTYGNFNDLEGLQDIDLFVEAVSEELEIKDDLWRKISEIAKDDAILATNTSGIPIRSIAKSLKESQQERFLGLHFFNPPRYMKLVEIIPHEKTDSNVVEYLSDFVTRKLGKGVVLAKDVQGFVANRIGTFSGNDVGYRAEQLGLKIHEVDALTGPILGRPRTATYRLGDLAGLDISQHVYEGMISNPEEEKYFNPVKTSKVLIEKGYLGDKTGQGYYKKEGKERLVFDLKTGDYVKQTPVKFDILNQLGSNLEENFNIIFESDDEIGNYLWETLRNVLYYSAVNVPKATDDFINIDRAMVWGYNWKLGPFQIWDSIGFDRVKTRIEKEIGPLPNWIQERNHFYEDGQTISPIIQPEEHISELVWDREDSKLAVTKDKILLFKMTSPNNTLTANYQDDLGEALEKLEAEEYKGMVLYSDGPHWSLGANLNGIRQGIEEKQFEEGIRPSVSNLHKAMVRLKFASKPVAVALRGRAFGGGAEIVLHSPFVVAAVESYVGLVEAGVGLIPGGGGLVELADRIYRLDSQTGEKIRLFSSLLTRVASGYVTTNAFEAQDIGFLKKTDVIVANSDLIFEAALDKVRYEAAYNYLPKQQATYEILGTDFIALAQSSLKSMLDGNFMSEYDYVIGEAMAEVLAGGKLPRGTVVNHEHLMKLEEDNFVKLCQNQKTYERIVHMLETRKPLRN